MAFQGSVVYDNHCLVVYLRVNKSKVGKMKQGKVLQDVEREEEMQSDLILIGAGSTPKRQTHDYKM